ncbi:potassium-transporting ATPase subunit F [Paenibacillus sp. LMG 31458]|uniref:Potassium-transporting ATPase subunit F n=1 Tax=Paenibacillus phytorum TaxID=2654977 RepID=A0ABX1XQQ1_9BACL|nr:potassium-transporting ATPase subunit F [Paenibacillus phytorum]NOU70863.1 potassium-transporting ATPase subunit F [Paenibacillus phytorum]
MSLSLAFDKRSAKKLVGGTHMIVIGVIAFVMMVYLGFVLVKPEKF